MQMNAKLSGETSGLLIPEFLGDHGMWGQIWTWALEWMFQYMCQCLVGLELQVATWKNRMRPEPQIQSSSNQILQDGAPLL